MLGNRANTSASQARVSTSLSLQVSISVYIVAASRAGIRTGEGPVTTPDGQGPDCALGCVVRHAHAAFLEEACKRCPAAQHVADRLGHIGLGRQVAALLPQPCLKPSDKRA